MEWHNCLGLTFISIVVCRDSLSLVLNKLLAHHVLLGSNLLFLTYLSGFNINLFLCLFLISLFLLIQALELLIKQVMSRLIEVKLTDLCQFRAYGVGSDP